MAQWHNAPRADTDGVHAAAGGLGAKAEIAPDTVSRGAGAECEIEITGSANARATNDKRRGRLPTRTQQARAHDVGASTQARVRHGH